MAEFCRECFIKLLSPDKYDREHIVMSTDKCVCEGCGEYKQYVSHIYTPAFGIDWSQE